MRNYWRLLGSLAVGTLAGCSGEKADVDDVAEPTIDTVIDGAADTESDPGSDPAEDSADSDVESDADAPPGPEAFWREPVPTETLPAPDGYRWARSIVHLHSTHSHDACDDEPRIEDGAYNLPCVESLRQALCDARIDVAYQTDHPTHMAEVPFVDLLHIRDGDEPISDDIGNPIASWIVCDSGHRVLLRAGAEDALMPVGMTRHVPGTPEERDALMNEYTAEAGAAMRETGAHLWVAHTEEKNFDDLQRVGIDGIEVYQLHANIDPRSREEHLGLDPVGNIGDLFPLIFGETRMHPDLAFLGIVDDNEPSLALWAQLLQERPVVGTAGTDAHENTFPNVMRDGERLDSYRRMMSWFSNMLLVEGELNLESAHAALGSGRVLIVFDLFGSPEGADFYVHSGDARHEMGSTLAWSEGSELRGTVPIPRLDTGEEGAARARVLRARGAEWDEVALLQPGSFELPLTEAGVYRVEVRTTGAHFLSYLDTAPHFAERDVPWLMTNAWRLE